MNQSICGADCTNCGFGERTIIAEVVWSQKDVHSGNNALFINILKRVERKTISNLKSN